MLKFESDVNGKMRLPTLHRAALGKFRCGA